MVVKKINKLMFKKNINVVSNRLQQPVFHLYVIRNENC